MQKLFLPISFGGASLKISGRQKDLKCQRRIWGAIVVLDIYSGEIHEKKAYLH
jgi:hypothetical protein